MRRDESMQVKDCFFTEAFVNFYTSACLELKRPVRFLTSPAHACPPCTKGCTYNNPNGDVEVFIDPRWSSRHAQQYAARAIFHHLILGEGYPSVRMKSDSQSRDQARKLCYRLNWRVLGLVVNQKMDYFFPNEQQDLLLTELFVNTVKFINICHECIHSHLELSIPVLDIFYQYFSLRPRQQRQLIGTIQHKWPQVYRLILQMVNISKDYSVMQPCECAKMLNEIIALLDVGEFVKVCFQHENGHTNIEENTLAYTQLCQPAF